MIKTKKKNIYLPLVVIGYVLFSLLVITTLIATTIPFSILLFDPRVLHGNVAVMLVAFTIGSLLPVLLGYIIGDHSVKTKSKLSHHFTGILFGLLSYWIMMLLTVFIALPSEFFEKNHNAGLVVVNVLPSIGVAIIVSILAVMHVRSRHAKKDILGYKPFSLSFIAAVLALPLGSLIQNVITNSVSIYSFIPLLIVAILGIISYVSLYKTKLSTYQKVTWAAVSVSVMFVAMFVLPQFVSAVSHYLLQTPTMETQSLVSWLGFGLALVGWCVYWFKQVKSLA